MKPKNPQLHDALLAYSRDAVALVATFGAAVPPVISSEETEWNRVNDDQFMLQRVQKHEWTIHLYRLQPELRSLPTFQAALSMLRADSVVEPQLDTLVGALGAGASRVEADAIADLPVRRMLAAADAPVFDLEVFENAYKELEDAFYATAVPMVLVAPVLGLKSDVETVHFSGGVEVGRPTDDELRMCLRMGLISTGTSFPLIQTSAIGVIRLRWNAVKVVGDDPLSAPGAEDAHRLDSERGQTVERVIHALRIYKPGRLQSRGLLRFAPGPIGRGGISFQSGGIGTPWFTHETYSLKKRDVPSLTKLWDGLTFSGVAQNVSLTGAIRRFGYAGERLREDDKLIDLSIAAEALFLPREERELAHKLSSRAAWFLRPRGPARAELYRQFKHAYGARGKVVHGEIPRKLHLADGSKATLAALTEEFEGFVREAVLRAIELARKGDLPTAPNDWDELTLGIRAR